jgi:polyisoprenoid-binding protein YceI|tara:strand:+ start:429 stop:965 length:537 start_codon:yes stop_codon:yes gene_type:complete
MKKVLFIFLFALVSQLSAQRYMTRNAEVYFLSDKEAVELVEAKNTQVGAVIDLTQSELAFQIQLRAFHFDIALMEEHFNENYVESEVYPKATFRGSFIDFPSDLTQQKELVVKGVMDFHGVQKEMEISVQLQIIDEVLYGESEFVLSCSDFGIEIPKLVSDKLADEINVTVKAILTKL